jgi:bifunctional enzyme CysN/CysC
MSPLRLTVAGGAGAGKSTVVDSLRESAGRGALVFNDARGAEGHVDELVAAALTADAGLIVVEAAQGLTVPVRREILLLSALGVRQLVLAVNKMDLVGWSETTFAAIEAQFRALAGELGLPAAVAVPIAAAAAGDNVTTRAARSPWYHGPTLAATLEALSTDDARLVEQPLRMPVTRLPSEPGLQGAGGTLVSGRVRVGDPVRVQPSGQLARVAGIVTPDGELEEAVVGQSVLLVFEDDGNPGHKLQLGQGDLVVASDAPADVADAFEATIVWTEAAPLLPGRTYLLRTATKTVNASVVPLKYKINPSNLQRLAAPTLMRAEVGVCNLKLDRPVAFDPGRMNRHTGGFVLIDQLSGRTAGAGLFHFALRRAQNVHWQALDVNKASRASLKGQRPCVLWYTGLSGAGKSTIANMVDRRLHSLGRHTYLLDGDNVRHGLNKDLGFTDADRVENIRRVAEVAKLLVDAGLVVGTAFISPFRAERGMARAMLAEGEFIEVHIDTPLGVAEERDPKGLYKKARRGDLKNFTGIDSPYEAPETPEIRIDTTATTPDQAAELIVEYLHKRGFLEPGGLT